MTPLQPIAALLEKEIRIDPWVGIPYNSGVLGSPRCKYKSESGYSSSFVSDFYKDTCKENCPGGIWYEDDGQCKMSCSESGLADSGAGACDVSDACANKRKYRDRTKKKCSDYHILMLPPVCYDT